jgi:hypothetical protein
MILRSILPLLLLPVSLVAQAELNGLRLDVIVDLRTYSGSATRPETYSLRVQGMIQNVSEHPITLPTSTHSGRPTSWGGGAGEEFARFSIGSLHNGDRKFVVSPIKYCVITLKPGEWTELPLYEARLFSPDQVTRARLVYEVEPDIAAEFGWWTGELEATAELKKNDPPNKPLHGTPAKAPSSSTEPDGRRP